MATILPSITVAAGAIISSKHRGSQRRYLLVQESRKDIDGLWSIPGGHLIPGETPIETAIREVREESGYEVQLTDIASIATRTAKGLTTIVFLFYGRAIDNAMESSPNDDEIKNVKWFTYGEIVDLAEQSLLREAEPALKAIEKAHYHDINADNGVIICRDKLIDVNKLFHNYPLDTVYRTIL